MTEKNKNETTTLSSFIKSAKDIYKSVTRRDSATGGINTETYSFELSKDAESQINSSSPTPAPVEKRQIITKELDNGIRKRLNGTIDIIDSRPCFLKPTYLLQNATPHVSAKLVMIGGNEGILAYDFLPPSELGKSQNIIKSFEYDVDTSSVKLSITDADQDIIEYMGFLFSNLLLTNPPILEVEFGWAHEHEQEVIQGNYIQDPLDEVSKAKIDTHVYFRRNVFCYIRDFESQYTPEGVLELTFVGQMSQNFPPPFQHFLPYDIVGRNPAVSIQMIHTLYVFTNYFLNRNKVVYNDLEYIAKFFFYFKHIKEEKSILLIVHKTISFFCSQALNNELNIKDPNSAWFKRLQVQIKEWNKATNETKFNVTPNVLNEGENKSININNIKQIFKAEGVYDSVEALRLQLKDFDGTQYSKNLRSYIMDLTPILGNALIHPYDALEYIKECLKNQGKKYGFSEANRNLFTITGFEDESIGGYDFKNKTHYDKGIERYLIKSADILVNPTSSWDELINSLASKCFVWINKTDADVLEKDDTSSGELAKINKDYAKKLKSKIQTSMTGNCFVVKKKEALFNLNTFRMILQARNADSLINKIDSFQNFDKINEAYETIKSLDNDAWVVLVSYDVIPGMNNLFDPLNGKNQILQAYSYRAGNVLAFTDSEGKNLNQYNPGYPNVWSINFPDVVSFQPKFNFKNQTDNLANVMKQGMGDLKKDIEEAEVELNRIKSEEVDSKKVKEKEDAIKKAIESIDALKTQQENFNKYHGRIPYQNPALMMEEDPFINISKHGDINARRKKMQEFRKHAILSSVNIDVDMEVLGDPIFNIHSKGKYLFVRYFTQLGDLSFFTGVYIIQGIKHSISSGRYTTSFTLQKDATVGSTEVADQIFRGFTENDNCYS